VYDFLINTNNFLPETATDAPAHKNKNTHFTAEVHNITGVSFITYLLTVYKCMCTSAVKCVCFNFCVQEHRKPFQEKNCHC